MGRSYSREREVDLLYKDIHTAMKEYIPRAYVRNCNSQLAWWSENLQAMRNESRRLMKNFQINRDHVSAAEADRLKEVARVSKLAYNHAIKRAKRAVYTEKLCKIETVKEMAEHVKRITKVKSPRMGLLMNAEGQIVTDPDEVGDIVLDSFLPGSKPIIKGCYGKARPHHKNKITANDISQEALEIHDTAKVILAFKSFNGQKAAGPDGLKCVIYQNMKELAMERIATIMARAVCLFIRLVECGTW